MAYALHVVTLQTPVGSIILSGTMAYVMQIEICGADSDPAMPPVPEDSPVMRAASQLGHYFDGSLREFDLPLMALPSARGAMLRAAIASIAYGETMTYGALAKAYGSAARAVGGACARNPYPIVIPCHRVTSRRGARENYSGGQGVMTKAWLNAHEARHDGKVLL